jgi:hypothetical protein
VKFPEFPARLTLPVVDRRGNGDSSSDMFRQAPVAVPGPKPG